MTAPHVERQVPHTKSLRGGDHTPLATVEGQFCLVAAELHGSYMPYRPSWPTARISDAVLSSGCHHEGRGCDLPEALTGGTRSSP